MSRRFICAPRRRGFTMIELLVVMAVLSLLTGIMAPALSKARSAAWQAGAASNQRQLFTGIATYALANDDFIPGWGTSGLELARATDGDAALQEISLRPDAPVQPQDWASPSLGDVLPTQREARMWWIWENLGDPAMQETVAVWTGGATGTIEAIEYAEEQGRRWPGTSFLMPEVWQFYAPLGDSPSDNFDNNGKPIVPFYPFDDRVWNAPQVRLPPNHAPRTSRFGQLSRKVALADGFRYHAVSMLDFDASIKPKITGKGAWASSSPIYNQSRAYGVGNMYGFDEPPAYDHPNGLQIPLSYRHELKMNAVHWDGHVELYTIAESHNPVLWYPSGSIWIGQQSVKIANELFDEGERLP